MYSLSNEEVENESTGKDRRKKNASTQTIITANDLKSISSSQSKMRAEDYINTFYSSKGESTSKRQPRPRSQDFESFLTLFANFYNKSEKDAKELWDSLSLAEKNEYFEKIYAIKKGK